MPERIKMITGADPFSEQLNVLPEAVMVADLEMIAVFAAATCIGDVRKHPAAWERTVDFPVASEGSDDDLDVAALPDTTPFEFNAWFGENAFAQLPLARLRTAEFCPAGIVAEFGRVDTEMGLDYEPAPWLHVEDRDAIEQRLVVMGFEVERRDQEFARYWDI